MKYTALLAPFALVCIAAAPALQAVPTPPPPPPQLQNAPATPSASTAPAATPSPQPSSQSLEELMPGVHPKGSPKPTPTPPADERKGLDGVWEVEIQHPDTTIYEHMSLKQDGTSLSGTYLTANKIKYPIAGSLDGKQIRLVVSLPDGSVITLEGRVDGTTDMLGMLTSAKERVPFTAAYRPKEKWTDNINAVPGGLGGSSGGGVGGGSGGGGGFNPP